MELVGTDLVHLRRCVELAAEAVERSDAPFGSVVVGGAATCLPNDATRSSRPATAPHIPSSRSPGGRRGISNPTTASDVEVVIEGPCDELVPAASELFRLG